MRILLLLVLLLCSSLSTFAQVSQTPILAFESLPTNEPLVYFMRHTPNGNVVYRIDTINDPSNTHIIGVVHGAAFDEATNEVFILAGTGSATAKNNRQIFKLDTTDCSIEFVVDPQSDFWQSLGYVPPNRLLLTVGSNNTDPNISSNSIYEVNTTSGAVSPIATLPTMSGAVKSLAYNIDNDSLYVFSSGLMSDVNYAVGFNTSTWTSAELEIDINTAFKATGATYIGLDNFMLSYYCCNPLNFAVFDLNAPDNALLDPVWPLTPSTPSNSLIKAIVGMPQPNVCPSTLLPLQLLGPGNDDVICSDTVKRIVTPDGDNPNVSSIAWFVNGVLDPTWNGTSFLDASNSGTYYVRITTTCGDMLFSDTVSLSLETAPTVPTLAFNGDDSVYCSSDVPEIKLATPALGDFTLAWFLDGIEVSNGSNDSYLPEASGNYSAQLRNAGNCLSPISDEISLILLTIDADISLPAPGTTIQLGDTLEIAAIGGSLVNVNWHLGDGSAQQSGFNITYVYTQPGNYTLEAILSDSTCDTIISREVVVETASSQSDALAFERISSYPNPVNTHLHVELPQQPAFYDTRVQLLDLKGHVVFEAVYSADSFILNTESLPKGSYLLEVETATNRYTRRIIK